MTMRVVSDDPAHPRLFDGHADIAGAHQPMSG